MSTGYVDLDGTGDYVSCGDNATFDIAGDIDLRVGAKFDVISGDNEILMARWSSGTNRHFVFTREGGSTLKLFWYTGTALISQESDTGLAITNPRHYRVTLDAANGANRIITFDFSDEDISTTSVTWTQHSQHIIAGTTSIQAAGTEGVTLGERIDTPGQDLDGRIYWGEMYNGIGGTRVLNPDFRTTDQGDWSNPPQTDDDSNSWAFNGDAVWVPFGRSPATRRPIVPRRSLARRHNQVFS